MGTTQQTDQRFWQARSVGLSFRFAAAALRRFRGPGMAQRILEPELMDDPQLSWSEHQRAMRALARINRLSRSARILWPPLRNLARQQPDRLLRVLDLATSGGDIPIQLYHRARRERVPLEITGLDISSRAVQFARTQADAAGAKVRFAQSDVVADELPGDNDVIICSLFLHHLSEYDAIQLLRRMGAAAGKTVLINDLRRSKAGLAAAHLVTHAVTRSPVVRLDGPQSVRAAFSMPEVGEMANQAGLAAARIERRWPFRFLLTWRRP